MDARDRIKKNHAKRYKSICTQMQNLLNEIAEYEPLINIYIEDSSNWNLMVGPSHDMDGKPHEEDVAIHAVVHPSGGGGGW